MRTINVILASLDGLGRCKPSLRFTHIWLQAKNFIRRYYHLCKDFKAVKILFEFFTDRQKFDFPKLHTYGIFS